MNDSEKVKELVRIFKRSGWNSDISSVFVFIQEFEARFSTSFDVFSRFLKAAPFVIAIVTSRNHRRANIYLSALCTVYDTVINNVTYPA